MHVSIARTPATYEFPPLVRPESWLDDAACRGVGTDVFYPEKPTRAGAQYRAAQRICRSCPVTAECLTAGMDDPHGVWGGLTPAERAQMKERTTHG